MRGASDPGANLPDGAAAAARSVGARGQRALTRWPAGVLLVGLAFSAAVGTWSQRSEQAQAQARFERSVDNFGRALGGQVQSYLDTLPGLRLLDLLGGTHTDLEFRQYVQAISLQQRFPGLALTFVASRVDDAQREAFVAAVRGDRSVRPDGHPEFDIEPPGRRPEYMLLRHQYPGDALTLGYDLYDPRQRYRAAVDEAIADGGYVATGPLRLARDRDKTGQPELTNIVVRAATYAGGSVPPTPEARRAAASGVVGVSFNVADIVRSMLPPELAGLPMRITDARAAAAGEPALLFDSAWLGGPSLGADTALAGFSLPVANRQWQVQLADAGARAPLTAVTLLLTALGAALSLALAALTRSLVSANLRAEAQVSEGLAALQVERDNLERSEARYRMLFENSLDAVLQTVPMGGVQAANPAACRLFGADEATLRSLNRVALFDVGDPRLQTLLDQRQATGQATGLCRMTRADGRRFEAELSTSAYTDVDGKPAASMIVRDVTERQNVEAQRSRLTAILDATPDFVGSADPQGRNLFLNRAARRMLGRGDDEDVSTLKISDCHPPWAARLILDEGIPAAVRDGSWVGRTAIAGAGGREIPVSQAIVCHRDAGGGLSHMSTIARDLSELEQAQGERQALELRMLETQKQESIGTLAGGIAHDFNNVLAAILGNTAMARRDLDPDHPTQQQLALVEQAASRARALVQQILTFSRRSPQAQTVLSLQAVVDDALALLRATLPATARLDVVPAAEPLPVLADATRLQQVVLNLCTNAWQALGDRPGHITIGMAAVHFDAATPTPAGLLGTVAGRCARLQVSDDGVGMDEATRARMFEPFYTTKPLGQGTGIGLSVVQGIVASSGGAIAVDSAPGQGTTVSIYLPLVAPEAASAGAAAPASAAAPDAPASSRSAHVLYVDDDEIMTLTVAAMLERDGYRVTALDSGAAALQAVERQPAAFDLVLTDHNMPGMSGLVLIERLHALAPQLALVLTSGYVTEALQRQALAAGARAVLKKEFGVERLAAMLDEILR